MDDYAREIQDLQRQVEQLEAEAAEKELVADLKTQLDILQALYRQATGLHQAGLGNEALRQALRLRGYGDWNLDNVYAFVFDTAVDLPEEPDRAFAREIKGTDFGSLLAG